MFKRLRDKLSERDKRYFKVAVWSCLLVWSFFFLTYSTIFSRYARGVVLGSIEGFWGACLGWVVPIWIVFTCLLIIYYIMRFTNRRLR